MCARRTQSRLHKCTQEAPWCDHTKAHQTQPHKPPGSTWAHACRNTETHTQVPTNTHDGHRCHSVHGWVSVDTQAHTCVHRCTQAHVAMHLRYREGTCFFLPPFPRARLHLLLWHSLHHSLPPLSPHQGHSRYLRSGEVTCEGTPVGNDPLS
jgi:hypothetical protein